MSELNESVVTTSASGWAPYIDDQTIHVASYVHAETQSERLMRLSNWVADVCAANGLERGTQRGEMEEIADVLGRLSRIVLLIDRLSWFDVP